MILAAGFGNRLKPITLTTPKPLVKVNNKALIDYAIEHLYEVGIKRIIVNTHYLAEQIHEHLKKYISSDIEIIISYEPEILETGGGILNAMQKHCSEPLLVINSDVYIDKHNPEPLLSELLKVWNPETMDLLLLLKDKDDIDVFYQGDFNLDTTCRIIRSTIHPHKYVFAGAYIVKPSFFNGKSISKFPIYELFFQSNDEDYMNFNFYGLPLKAKWFDIGTLERLNKLEKYLKQKNGLKKNR
jgi:MurNAc alpha-1-phosphate uridylyltransferase